MECTAFVARVLLLTRARSRQGRRPSVDKPTGRHQHDSKPTEACAQVKPALSRNADAPIGATAAVQDIGGFEEYQRKNRISCAIETEWTRTILRGSMQHPSSRTIKAHPMRDHERKSNTTLKQREHQSCDGNRLRRIKPTNERRPTVLKKSTGQVTGRLLGQNAAGQVSGQQPVTGHRDCHGARACARPFKLYTADRRRGRDGVTRCGSLHTRPASADRDSEGTEAHPAASLVWLASVGAGRCVDPQLTIIYRGVAHVHHVQANRRYHQRRTQNRCDTVELACRTPYFLRVRGDAQCRLL